LLATLRKKTSERICMKFSRKVGNAPMNKWLNFSGDPDHHLDTGIVFRIHHYWKIRKVASTDCAARRCSAGHTIAIATMTSLRHRPRQTATTDVPWRRYALSQCFYTVSEKTSHFWLAIILTHTIRLRECLAEVLPRKYEMRWCIVFPPHVSSGSALPCKTGNPEIASFHLNAVMLLCQRTHAQNTFKLSPGRCWITLHSQSDRLYASDS